MKFYTERMNSRRAYAVSCEGLTHRVAQGESIDSLAYQYGHASDTIWKHPSNETLFKERGDWRVLYPGDEVFIPPLNSAEFQGERTGRRHIYRRTDVPSLLRFRPLILGESTKGAHYEVRIDGDLVGEGITTENGDVEYELIPDEENVSIRVFFEGFSRDYEIRLRALDPIYEMTGIQQRLAALGFYQGDINGEVGSETDNAISRFRMHYGLHHGEGLDEKLRDALHRLFGG